MSSCIFINRDVDDVHDLMDDIQEQNELATEISDALSSPFGLNQDIDEVMVHIYIYKDGECHGTILWGKQCIYFMVYYVSLWPPEKHDI